MVFFLIEDGYLVKREGLGEGKAPALLKGSAYHRCAGGGWSTGQAEWVREFDPTHFHADVHGVDGRVKQRQLWLTADRLPVDGLQRETSTFLTFTCKAFFFFMVNLILTHISFEQSIKSHNAVCNVWMQIAEGYSTLHSSTQSHKHVYRNNRPGDRMEETVGCIWVHLFIEGPLWHKGGKPQLDISSHFN